MRTSLARSSVALLVALLAGLGGCNAIAGIHEPIDGDPNATPAPPTVSPLDAFVGRWVSDAPPIVDRLVSCGNPANNGKLPEARYGFTMKGLADGTLQVTTETASPCVILMSVQGSVARLKERARCGGVEYTDARFTLTEPGVGTSESLATVTDGVDVCQYEAKLVLRRVGP